ncbi:MAG: bifunctional UDP-3-O-[3-hydroxymyristoyl] N-acetylglucosamine deacetylase/3-hydroxyacyl-ACP dehydratase [Chitinophagales bacterium]|nr:bifunctional UDP-3-O-[3-hydroxymyristoyl] N-acetylglucosamine deacetylase/3-hydroxyacyl-ACP dehydratase [Chitinophagales bacterium]
MTEYQHTIGKEVIFDGRGLHTGQMVNVVIKPALPGHGFVFKRVDLPEHPEIKADCDLVVEVARGTTLESNGIRVSTVEHLLGALFGMNIDNALIELDGQEIPILDGSAKPFADLLKEAGVHQQDEEKKFFVLEETINFYDTEKDVEMMAIPSDHYSVDVMIDYNSQVLGKQYAKLKHLSEFYDEFAASRTFCFLHEVEPLLEGGLIKGGDLENAIVIAENRLPEERFAHIANLFNVSTDGINREGIVNKVEMRYPNEPARHKLVDVIGDLALIGTPIKCKIIASKPGHAGNVRFAQKIKKYIKEKEKNEEVPKYDPNQTPIFDLSKIEKILPHRFPFLLIDKIVEMSETHIVGIKNVTFNEPFFVGHFPGNPVMPGVLQIEAMAQTGGILVLTQYPDPENYLTYFLKVDNCRFKNPVKPGDTMIIKLELLQPIKRGISWMKGAVFVGKNLVTEAELTAKVFKP